MRSDPRTATGHRIERGLRRRVPRSSSAHLVPIAVRLAIVSSEVSRAPSLFAAAAIWLLPATSFAQFTYVSRQYSAAYVPLSNGSVALQAGFGFGDDARTFPLGFSFQYYGRTYTNIGIAENGAASFAGACSQGCDADEFCSVGANFCERFSLGIETDGVPSPNIPNKLLAPWWDDLALDTASPASVILYDTLGTAPNREFVIEWRNIRHATFTGGTLARGNFQIHLEEGTNTIRFAYGPFSSASDDNQWSSVIGIEDDRGMQAVVPYPCSNLRIGCDYTVIQSLTNQVIEFSIPDLPELTGAVTAPLGGLPGETVQFFVRADNIGREPTNLNFQGAVYLSLDAAISPSADTFLGVVNFDALGVGHSETATLTVTLPNLPIGYYFVGAVIDSQNRVMEGTEANNTVVATTAFLLGSDLEASFPVTPIPLPTSGTGSVSAGIINHSSSLSNVGWRIYLSSDSVLGSGDQVIAESTLTAPARATAPINALATVQPVSVGSYYEILVVDPEGRIAEIDETNNRSTAGPVLVGPDLVPASASGPPTSGPNEAINLTIGIQNNGYRVRDANYAVYLSETRQLDLMTATLVATGTIPVGTAATASQVKSVTVPAGLASGRYFLIVSADPHDALEEVDETNNIVAFNNIQIIGPDLDAVSVSGDPFAFRGLPYPLHGVVKNIGGQVLSNFYCTFHLSTNNLITVSDPLLIQIGPLTLAPGEQTELSPMPVLPPNTMAGPYYLGLIVDATSAIAEGNENNNIARTLTPIVVRDTAPDFSVSEILVPAEGAAGEAFPIQRVLENHGNAGGSFAYDVYLSNEAGTMRIALIGQGMATIDAAAIQTGVDDVLVPASVAHGIYKVEYAIDPMMLVGELNEMNNSVKSHDTIMIESSQMSIVSGQPPLAIVGVPYRYDFVARGGSGPLTWSVSSGMPPMGLTLDPQTGRLAGTPLEEALARFRVRVSDGTLAVEQDESLLVSTPSTDLEIATRSIPPAWAGQPYEYPLTALGGVPPYRWSNMPALPMGLVLTSSGGLEGMSSTTANAIINFQVADAVGKRVTAPLVVRVLDRSGSLRFGLGTLGDGVVGMPYSEMLAATGGSEPYAFSIADGEIPPGLAIDGATVAGTPTRPGVYQFRLRVTDADGDFDLNYFVVTINSDQGVRFVTKGLPQGTVDKEYLDEGMRPVFVKAIGSDATSSLHYLVANGSLPPGLMLNDDGFVRGTPTKAGVYAFSVAATNDAGEHDIRAFGIVIADASMVTPPSTGKKGCGCTSARAAGGSTDLAPWLAIGLLAVISGLLARRRARALAPIVALSAWLSGADALAQGTGIPYFTSSFSEPFTLRTTGTTPLITTNGSIDDGEAILPLPFSFQFFENMYDQVHVSTNGYVAFDTTATSFGNHSVPSTTQPTNLIAALWDDLESPSMSYVVEGNAPSRVVVIQWQGTFHFGGRGDTADFQVWLYEGPSARFEIRYGASMSTSGTFTFTSGFENLAGDSGFQFLACSPSCGIADLTAENGMGYRALQDGGTELVAISVALATTADPIHVYQNIPFDVTSVFSSYHGQPIGPFVYTYNLVPAGQSAPVPTPVFTSTAITTAPYETRRTTDSVSIPLTTAPGRYRLALLVDANDQIMEPNEANNIAITSKEFLVGERQPDLTAGMVTVSPARAAPSDPIDISVALQNAGNLDSAAKWIAVLTTNPAPTISDLQIYASPSPVPIAAGTSVTENISATLPQTLTPGRYYIGVVVDPNNTVEEINEVNNTAHSMSPIQVGSPNVEIATTDLPIAYVGVDYSAYLEASGGDGSYVWELTSGPLPPGLTFISGLGQIKGTPSAAGPMSITVRVSSNGQSAMRTFMIDVEELHGPLTIVTRSFLPGVVGGQYPPAAPDQDVSSQQHVVAVGGAGPATFTITSTGPRGLVLDPDGYLHGIPTARGVFDLDIAATDGMTTVRRSIPLTIVEPGRLSLIVGPLASGVLDEPYAESLEVVGQSPTSTLTFSVVQGAGDLPDGLALNTIGEIAGIPTKAGTWSFSIEVSESDGSKVARDNGQYELTIEAPATLGIAPSSLPDAAIGVPYEATLEAHNGTAPYTWTVDLPVPLPPDLKYEVVEMNGATKLHFSGTPNALPSDGDEGRAAGGILSFLVKLKDSAGRHVEQAFSLRFVQPPTAPKTSGSGGCHCSTSPHRSSGGRVPANALICALLIGALVGRSRKR
jgi:subtilase family serine protease